MKRSSVLSLQLIEPFGKLNWTPELPQGLKPT